MILLFSQLTWPQWIHKGVCMGVRGMIKLPSSKNTILPASEFEIEEW